VVAHYQKGISGPLLDQIDIHVEVPRVNCEKLRGERLGAPSAVVRERVTAARQRQAEPFKSTRLRTNANMGPAAVREHCRLGEAGQRQLQAAMRQLHLSARATTACSSSPARSPTWPGRRTSARRTWPRRSNIDRDGWSRR